MRKISALLIAGAILLIPALALAASGFTTVTINDGGGTGRTVNVNSSTGLITGNLSWLNTICDFTTLTQCASVTSSNALKVDGSAVTQPVSNAGTFAVQATLQASATTAIGKVDPNTIASWGLVASTQNSATPTNGGLVEGQFNTTPTTITSGNVSPLQMDSAGNLLVNVKAGGGSGGTSSSFSSAFPSTGTAVGQSNGTNMVPFLADSNGYTEVNVKTATGLAQGSTTSGQTGSLVMGAVTTAAPSYTTAQTSPVSIDTLGNTRVAQYYAAGAAGYPVGATPYTATATGTTAATTATLTGASSVTTYICGFSIRANATAAATGNATVTGTITGTLNFTQWTAPLASGLGVTEEIFSPCVPASTTNTSIAVVSAAPGSGGTVSVTAWGFKL